MAFPRKALSANTLARLEAIANLSVYLSSPPKTPPPIGPNDPRVRPYAVLHAGSGAPTDETNQGDEVLDLEWGFQVTCVVGIPEDLPTVVDNVTDRLERWQPIAEPSCGVCKQISNFDTPFTDNGQSPVRFFIPLIYRVPLGI